MNLKQNIEDCDLVFLDLETTGLDVVEGDAICEIGAYKVRESKTVDKFHSLVNPKKRIPQEAYNLHKISNEDLKSAPYFSQIVNAVRAFLKDSVVCAYNVEFDIGFLDYELKRMDMPPLEVPAIDVLTMARRTLKLSKYNLEVIAQFFNIKFQDKLHRALNDAYAALEVFFKLRDMLQEKGINTAGEYLSLYGLDNEVFKKQEESKIRTIKETLEAGKKIKLRYVFDNDIKEADIQAVNFSQEKGNNYIWCHGVSSHSFRIRLSDILHLEAI